MEGGEVGLGRRGLRLGLLVRGTPDPPPLRVPRGDYQENLRDIVTALEKTGTKVILVQARYHLTPEAKGRLVQTRYLVREDDAEALHREYFGFLRLAASETDALLLDGESLRVSDGASALLAGPPSMYASH